MLATDRLDDLGGTLATLSAETNKLLDQVLPPTWSHGNPVDIIAHKNRFALLHRIHSSRFMFVDS